MKTSIIGYPRIGAQRELKFWTEDYFKGELKQEDLLAKARELRKQQWLLLKKNNIDFIPANDFSFYDGMLDMALLLNVVPASYKSLELDELDTYFAMARGYQGEQGDVKALPMKKWFNTNYHYIVPLFEDATELGMNSSQVIEHYQEALSFGVKTKPVLIGPLTLLKLSAFNGKKKAADFVPEIIGAYQEVLAALNTVGAEWIQIDEPVLVTDLTPLDIEMFTDIYTALLENKGQLKLILQTYFGDIRDCYREVTALGFDGIGLDFVEGRQSLGLVKKYGFSEDTELFAGIVNGKNVWKNSYADSLALLQELADIVAKDRIIVGAACSFLHVPYTTKNEDLLAPEHRERLAFAEEKLDELGELKALFAAEDYADNKMFRDNLDLFTGKTDQVDLEVRKKYESLSVDDFIRQPELNKRRELQRKCLKLPLLPTTTIGSFPQTYEIRALRANLKKGGITRQEYEEKIKENIGACIALQEQIGLDVLVHGEFERNDMVEYFGENFNGFLFTQKAWVQSYGTRCVKPPVIWGDVSRARPITVEYIQYAQSLTAKPVKGMLTGPVTILNWSFPREDITPRAMAFQIALAIKEEVQDLEAAGIRIIQIDEAALKEKLPLRKEDWYSEYLEWAIPAFRLVHSRVKAETQIHTHMCYSEFEDIIRDINAMDADVISFEASRSNLSILAAIRKNNFAMAVGPGIYDIHSPRVPGREEMVVALRGMLNSIDPAKLWVNPDCGLKTRGMEETLPSLQHMVEAAAMVRKEL